MDVSPPETLKNPIHVPQKLLMGPGPSNVSQRVLNAQALPTLGHLHTEFCKVWFPFLDLTQIFKWQRLQDLSAIMGGGGGTIYTRSDQVLEYLFYL